MAPKARDGWCRRVNSGWTFPISWKNPKDLVESASFGVRPKLECSGAAWGLWRREGKEERIMKRAGWLVAGLVMFGVQGAPQAAPKATATGLLAPKKSDPPVKDVPLKVNAALKPKIDKRMAPFKFGMTSAEAMAKIDEQIDELYQKKIAGAYNPKQQAQLEKERDKKKVGVRDKLIKFTGTGGVSGYEMKAPGEFTYKNNESALEVVRESGGTQQLFFISDRLYKIYIHYTLGGKDNELGETWDSALSKFEKDILGEKGKLMAEKSTSAAYFGTIIIVPTHYLWSDGTTQVRLVDHTKREDTADKTVGIAYEEVATLEKLPTFRTKIETKGSDSAVDKAGFTAPVKDDKDKDKKKK
jgi:hypothetical protein